MTELIEVTILNYLKEHFGDDVFLEKPITEPEEYILIERQGGGIDNHINSALFTFQSIAASLEKAAILNYKLIEALKNIIILDRITKSELNTTYDFTDTETKKYRYQAVFDIYFY